MQIHLDDELKAFLANEVEAGRYKDVSEAINAMVRGQLAYKEKLDALRAEIQIGIDAADRGEFAELTREDLKAHIRRLARA